jgi:hypothetical protein
MHYSATGGNPIAGPAGACPTMQRIKGNYYLTSAETGRSCPAHRRCRCAWVGVGRRACSGHGTSQPTSRSEHRSLGTPTWSTPLHSAQTGRLSRPVGSPYGDRSTIRCSVCVRVLVARRGRRFFEAATVRAALHRRAPTWSDSIAVPMALVELVGRRHATSRDQETHHGDPFVMFLASVGSMVLTFRAARRSMRSRCAGAEGQPSV